MTDALLDRSTLSKFAGLALGIMIGGPLGPLVFGVTGLGDATRLPSSIWVRVHDGRPHSRRGGRWG